MSHALRRRYGHTTICTPCGVLDLPADGTAVHTRPAYEAFRRAHPAIRHFQPYTSDQRAMHASSRRLGPRKQKAVGEFFYTHPMLPDRAYATAKQATMAAFALHGDAR
jgi:hypothetical protein